MPTTATTTLPDEDQPELGNGVEDEVAVDREDAVTNNGDVRVQIRETETGEDEWDDSTGFDETTVAYDTLTLEFTGREDGEEYEVRARTETEHVTGAWTDPVAITTEFPGVTDFEITDTGATSVDMEWTDNADNEDGQEILRERRVDDEWWPPRVVEDVGPNTESYTDDTAQPDCEYRYSVRAHTEHTSVSSETDTTTTDDIGLSRRRVPPRGWYVEIDTPSGRTLTPAITDVQRQPSINDLPEIEVTVPDADHWRSDELEGATARVWKNGRRQPIEEFVEPRSAPDGVTLRLRGGSELDQYVDDISFTETEAQEGVEEILDDYTDLAYSIDDPDVETEEDIELLQLSGGADWDDVVEDEGADAPVESLNGFRTVPVGFWQEAENTAGDDGGTNTDEDGRWSGGEAVELDSSFHSKSATFTLEHEVPAEDLVFGVFFSNPDGNPELELSIDGETVETVLEDALTTGDDIYDLRWVDASAEPASAETLGPGDVDVAFDLESSGETLYVDGLYLYDDRYVDGDLPETVDGGVLDVPEYPEYCYEISVESGFQITAGRLDVEMDDTPTNQRVRISNDGGETWISEDNAESVSGEFDDPSGEIIAQVRFGGYDDDPDETPGIRDETQVIEELTLYADLDDTPLLIGKHYRGTLREILREIADDGDWIWTLEWDNEEDALSVEWTQPGLREATVDQSLVEYEVSRDSTRAYDRAVVFGTSRSVEGEEFEATEPGFLVGLEESYIVHGSETVYDPDDEDTTYSFGDDYEMDWAEGAIEITDDGDMAEDETYAIDYGWKVRGEYELGGADDPRTLEEEIPDANTTFECEQLALGLLKELQDAPIEATATLPRGDVGFGLVEMIDLEELPTDEPLRVRGIEETAEEISLRLGSRRSVGEVVGELTERLDRVSRRV